MRLSSLTVKGFKSFRNETVFNFSEDVIGIIGPNGSGKSNVIDAIRWVLGETKSRELRLQSMSNLIFNGTSKIKASNQAKVTLTFENTKNLLPTEYNNVSISRVINKDGGSEYRLNDVKCRRKDILSLFMDTGIGSNSYAIIELAMVDSILQDKDNSRRTMFEQAAGISKYKTRKRETMLKLKNTNADLERVEDLLVEIEDNLKRIEKQAKRTKRYYELKDIYRTKSTAFAKMEISHLEEEMSTSQAKINEQKDLFVKLQTEANTLDASIEKQKKDNLDSEKILSEKQKELSALLEDLRSKETEKRLAKEKLQYLINDTQRVEAELKSANPRIAQIEQEINTATSEMFELEPQKAQLEGAVQSSEDELTQLREQYKSEKDALERIVNEQRVRSEKILGLEREKGQLSGQIENITNQLGILNDQLPEVEKELKRLESEQLVLNEKEAKAFKTLELQQENEEEQKQKIASSEEDLESLKNKLSKVSRIIDAKRNEYKLTKSMVENLEGYPDSIKFLSKNNKWSTKAILLSDIITCDSDYRVAIENYLEPYLNFFVVPKHKDAQAGIKLLRDSQKGKANFFITEAAKKQSAKAPKGADVVPALDHVKFEKGYQKLAEHLLGNVFISNQEDLSEKDVSDDIIVISRGGGIILQNAKMSGGSIGLFEGKKIGRKKGMEKLAKELEQLEKEEIELKQKVDSQTQNLGQLKLDIRSVDLNTSRDQLSNIQKELAGLNAQIASQRTKNDELQSRKSKSSGYLMELEGKLASSMGSLTSIRDEEENSSTGGEDMSLHIQKLNEKLQQTAGRSNDANIALIQFNNKVNSITQMLNIKQNQLDELVTKTSEGSAILEKHAEQQVDLKVKIDNLSEELEEAYVVKAKATSSLNEVETTYFQSRSGIYDQEDQLRKLNQKVASAQSIVNGLKDERQRIEFRVQGLLDRLSVEFKITKEDIMAFESKMEMNAI